MSADARKQMKKMVKELVQEGWFFEQGKKHGRIYTPDRSYFLVISMTPSDTYAAAQFSRDVKRVKAKMNIE